MFQCIILTTRQTFIMYLISYTIKDRKTKTKNLGHDRAILSGRSEKYLGIKLSKPQKHFKSRNRADLVRSG